MHIEERIGEQAAEQILKVMAIDDDRITLKFVQACLKKDKGYVVMAAADGGAAKDLMKTAMPDIVVTDWLMPIIDGLELTRWIRAQPVEAYIYIILLTARSEQDDIVKGLAAGADDYISKPFNQDELMARVRAGARVVRAQKTLSRINIELKEAMAQIKTLKGLLPICMDCKKIRDDKDYWLEIDDYIRKTTDAEFSHGLCPDCLAKRLKELKFITPKPDRK